MTDGSVPALTCGDYPDGTLGLKAVPDALRDAMLGSGHGDRSPDLFLQRPPGCFKAGVASAALRLRPSALEIHQDREAARLGIRGNLHDPRRRDGHVRAPSGGYAVATVEDASVLVTERRELGAVAVIPH